MPPAITSELAYLGVRRRYREQFGLNRTTALVAPDPDRRGQYMPSVILRGMHVFEAVAEPTRRAVLDLLAGRERSAGEIVAAFPALTQPAVSRHLRILRESQLVDVRADGTRRVYSLRPAALAELDRWLDSYRRFWGARLDDLESHLDSRTGRESVEEAK